MIWEERGKEINERTSIPKIEANAKRNKGGHSMPPLIWMQI